MHFGHPRGWVHEVHLPAPLGGSGPGTARFFRFYTMLSGDHLPDRGTPPLHDPLVRKRCEGTTSDPFVTKRAPLRKGHPYFGPVFKWSVKLAGSRKITA